MMNLGDDSAHVNQYTAKALKDTQDNYSLNNTSAGGTRVSETWTPLGFADFGRYEKNKTIIQTFP